MLSAVDSTYNAELEMLKQFSFGLQIVEDVIVSRLSEDLKFQNIAINLSPLLNDPLFCSLNQKETNQMRIKDFLNKCIERWHQEALYQQHIVSLKEQIIDEFDKLCSNMSDENLIEIAKKQREQIVETLFAKTNFDKKNLAGDFCKNLMNGFEIEMIKNIDYYAAYVVWMPYIMALPEGLVEYLRNVLYEETNKTQSEASIMSASAKIIKFIEDQLTEREIKIQKEILTNSTLLMEKNIIVINQLRELLKTAEANKKACSLIINEVGQYDDVILNERANIQTIYIKMKAKEFLEANISFTYEFLELNDLEDELDFKKTEQILLKLSKCLKCVIIEFKNNKQNGIKIIKNEQKNVYELTFAQNGPSYSQMKFLARLFNHLQFAVAIPKLQCCPGSKGTDEDINMLSNLFTHSKAFQHLNLDFTYAEKVTAVAVNNLASSIINMNQIKFLSLNFRYGKNSVTNNSMGLFAQAISEMVDLNHLDLHFASGKNEITDDGIMQLSLGLAKSTNILQLFLNFSSNKDSGNGVTDKGLIKLSQSIANFNRIQQLKLGFRDGNHQISDKGMQELSVALKNTTNISDLELNFYGGKNSITDSSMNLLADALKQMSLSLSIELYFQSNNRPRVTNKGESIIRSVRTYSKIEFYHSGQCRASA